MIKGFYFFESYRNALCKYQNAGDYEGQCMLLHAMLDYIFDNKPPEFTDHHLAAAWEFLLPHLKESLRIEEERLTRKEAQKKAAEMTNKKKKEKAEALNKRDDSETEALNKRDDSETVASRKNKNENMNKNKNIETETESATFTAPVSGDSSVTIPELIDFYLDMGLQSKFLQSSDDGNEFELSEFAVKNIDLYTSKKRLIRDNFEDYKKYAVSCYNKAKEAAGLKGG